MKRLTCPFCDRKFLSEDDLGRHTRALHRKTARIVEALRGALEPFAAHGDRLDSKGQCSGFHDGYILSESPSDVLTIGHCRHASRILFETGPHKKIPLE